MTKQRHLISAYFTREEWEALVALCADQERSMASLVGRIVRTYLTETGAIKEGGDDEQRD